jgi:structural maintenance of chromosome 2
MLWTTDAQATLRAAVALSKQHAKLEGDLELKEHSLALLQDRVAASEAHQLAEAVARCEADLTAATAAYDEAVSKGAAAKAEAARLEKEIGAFANDRDKRLKAAEKSMKDARAAVAASRAGAKAMEDRAKALLAERKAAAEELSSLQEQMAAAAAQVAATAAEAAALETKVAKRKAAYEACSGALEESKQRARACDREVTALSNARAALEKTHAEKLLEAKKLEHKVARLERDARDADERVARLQQAHPWIAAERALFGRAGGDYDWEARAPDSTARELAALEAEQEKLSKSVNKKVLGMFDKAEAEYKELTEKRRIVMNDKDKIEAVIYELDEKKKEALVATWQQVNRDFGSIFSMLLPGTSAKLEPPEGGTCLDGLEVRVAFGSVWKQSLTELSGGQRSLLALSLILALLLFKARSAIPPRAARASAPDARARPRLWSLQPAPIYILDEVDAALDLSHTQNIGRMIRTHFPYSQFIVVSLKEGMFNNANVIFRTKVRATPSCAPSHRG